MNDSLAIDTDAFVRLVPPILYGAIFFVGIGGNICVLANVGALLYGQRLRRPTAAAHVYMYVFALCLADLSTLLPLPLIATATALHTWPFGAVLCKLSWTLESVGKVMSIAVLTLVSVDRYVAACHIALSRRCFVQPRFQRALLAGCLGVVVLLLAPILWYVRLGPSAPARLACMAHDMPMWLQHTFALYTFALLYCLPGLLIAYCYGSVIYRAWRQHRYNREAERQPSPPTAAASSNLLTLAQRRHTRSDASHRQLQRVRRAVTLTVIFYYGCWTPYWLLVATPFIITSDFFASTAFMRFALLVHSLPFVSAAGNWIFYAWRNDELRRAARLTLVGRTLSAIAFRVRHPSASATATSANADAASAHTDSGHDQLESGQLQMQALPSASAQRQTSSQLDIEIQVHGTMETERLQ